MVPYFFCAVNDIINTCPCCKGGRGPRIQDLADNLARTGLISFYLCMCRNCYGHCIYTKIHKAGLIIISIKNSILFPHTIFSHKDSVSEIFQFLQKHTPEVWIETKSSIKHLGVLVFLRQLWICGQLFWAIKKLFVCVVSLEILILFL